MSRNGRDHGLSHEEGRALLAARLQARRHEIEQAILVRVSALVDPAGALDAEYIAGLPTTVTALVNHGLIGIEQGDERSGPIPPEAVAQAQRAARNGVSLETVLCRYIVANTLLGDFVMQEAQQGDLLGQGATLLCVRRTQGAMFDHIIFAIIDEYKREVQRVARAPEQRLAERVLRLLGGEFLDTADFHDYRFDVWHLGVIAMGTGATKAVSGLAAGLDCRLLSVARGEETVWAWLGGQRRIVQADIERPLTSDWPPGVSLAVGESARGIDGFRLTHQQAQGALRIALRRPQKLTQYADVALLTAVLQDDMLARWLVDRHLSPLDGRGCPHATLCETLRAYLAAGRNATAAAASLGVNRRTMRNRMVMVEECLDPLHRTHQAELEVALRLDALGIVPQ